MGVHLFRVFVGINGMSESTLKTGYQDWIDTYSEWADDLQSHSVSQRTTPSAGDTYYGGDARFLQDHSVSTILSDIESLLQGNVDWYRIGYHNCANRPEDGTDGDCSFDANVDPDATAVEWTASGVTIPSSIPDFPSSAYS